METEINDKFEVEFITPRITSPAETKRIEEILHKFGPEILKTIQILTCIQRELTKERARKPHICWQLIAKLVEVLASPDPFQPHYEIAREVLQDIDPKLLKNEQTVDTLAREINNQFKKLKLKPPQDFNELFDEHKKECDQVARENGHDISPDLEVLEYVESNDEFESMFKKDNMYIWDQSFLSSLEKIGPEGKKAANAIRPKIKLQNNSSQTDESLKRWVNTEKPEKSIYISAHFKTLGKVIYRDKVKVSNHVPRIRHSSDYVANKLRHDQITSTNIDNLPLELQTIPHKDMTVKCVGIHLSPYQDKIMNTLFNMIQDNRASDSIYAESSSKQRIIKGRQNTVFLITNQHQYMKTLAGKSDYSGAEIKSGINGLLSLDREKRLMCYRAPSQQEKSAIDQFLVYESLITWIRYRTGISLKDLGILDDDIKSFNDNNDIWIIGFHRVCTEALNSRYVLYPLNIDKLTADACGGSKKITSSITKLRDFALQQISFKQQCTIRNEAELDSMLGLDEEIRRGGKKRGNKKRDTTITAIKKMNLIKNCKTQIGKQGQKQYSFEFNLDYNKLP